VLVRERRDPNRGAESKKRKDPCISDRGAPYRRSHRQVLVEAFPQTKSQLTKSFDSDFSFFDQLGHAWVCAVKINVTPGCCKCSRLNS
jgi:hypothetical protein